LIQLPRVKCRIMRIDDTKRGNACHRAGGPRRVPWPGERALHRNQWNAGQNMIATNREKEFRDIERDNYSTINNNNSSTTL